MTNKATMHAERTKIKQAVNDAAREALRLMSQESIQFEGHDWEILTDDHTGFMIRIKTDQGPRYFSVKVTEHV